MTIDWWTLGLQTVNIVILVWLLQRFFWRPIAGMIDRAARRRATGLGRSRGRARRGRSRARRHRAVRAPASPRSATRFSPTRRAEAERDGAAQAGGGRRSRRRRSSRRRKRASRRTRTRRPRPGRAARPTWRWTSPSVWPRGSTARPCAALFLDWALAAIRALPETARRGGGPSLGVAIEATSAAPLDPAEQDARDTVDRRGVRRARQIRLQDRSEPDRGSGTARATISWSATAGGPISTEILAELAHDK